MRKTIVLGLGAAAVAVAAGCSSSPSTTSGTEVLSGSTANISATSLPLTLSGPVATHGALELNNSNSTQGVIKTAVGDLHVTHNNPSPPPSVNTSSCTATQVNNGNYKITGGTGKFSGAAGHGNFTISFTGTFPKTNGQCSITQSSNPVSGTTTFHGSGPITVKG